MSSQVERTSEVERRRMRWRAVVLAIASLIVGSDVIAAIQNTTRPKATGIFSTLEYHRESGDVTGIEIFVVNSKRGYTASVQISEGEPDAPVLVPVQVNGASLSFELTRSGKPLKFTGTVRSDGLFGRFDNGAFSDNPDGSFLMKRGRSYWQ